MLPSGARPEGETVAVQFSFDAWCAVEELGDFLLWEAPAGDENFADYRRRADFIQTYIFPGGMLPCRAALREHAHRVGLKWLQDDGFAAHYARTLEEWREKFLAAWPRIRTMGFDERFRRLWVFYLASCEGSFRARGIDVLQIALVKS